MHTIRRLTKLPYLLNVHADELTAEVGGGAGLGFFLSDAAAAAVAASSSLDYQIRGIAWLADKCFAIRSTDKYNDFVSFVSSVDIVKCLYCIYIHEVDTHEVFWRSKKGSGLNWLFLLLLLLSPSCLLSILLAGVPTVSLGYVHTRFSEINCLPGECKLQRYLLN